MKLLKYIDFFLICKEKFIYEYLPELLVYFEHSSML